MKVAYSKLITQILMNAIVFVIIILLTIIISFFTSSINPSEWSVLFPTILWAFLLLLRLNILIVTLSLLLKSSLVTASFTGLLIILQFTPYLMMQLEDLHFTIKLSRCFLFVQAQLLYIASSSEMDNFYIPEFIATINIPALISVSTIVEVTICLLFIHTIFKKSDLM